MHTHDEHDDFGGLAADLPRLVNRRRALLVLGGGGMAALLAACNSGSGTSAGPTTTSSTSSPSTSSSTSSSSGTSPTSEIPDETGGPYPGDGSNGPNVLTESGVVRQDIRPSFAQY